MQIHELSVGGNVELEVKLNGRNMSFQSDIVHIKNNSVLINTLKVNDQTIGFSEKCYINFIYKTDGRVFIWKNVSAKLVKYNGAIYHRIDVLGDGKPYNRRDAYRMYIGEDMPVFVNTSSGPIALLVLVKDISETGVAFITKEQIDIDRTFRLKLKDNHSIISLSGDIVRKEYLENLDSFLYGCKFSERNNQLGKYIARKQCDLLRQRMSRYSSPPAKEKKSNAIANV